MKSENGTGKELALLLKEKDTICISIIVPTHPLSPERRADPIQVEKAISRAREYLMLHYAAQEVKPLLQSLDGLYRQIDFNHNTEGIGLFVSPHVQQLVRFIFPVKEKVIINRSFEIRDFLYEAYYSLPYFALVLNGKGAQLFKGRVNTLQEVTDDHFPKKHVDDYEYNRPTRGSSYVGQAFLKEFEKDKSQLQEIRYKDFLGRVDDALNGYVFNKTPLIVAGAQKDRAYFEKTTRHIKNIEGVVPGNYAYTGVTQLGKLTWEAMKSFLDHHREELVSALSEKIGEGHAITDIHAIWKAAKEGRGLQLLVEKDYTLCGFLKKEDDYHLYLHAPQETHHILPDVVNELIRTVLEKNGEVIPVENKTLMKYHHIALVTRY